MIYPTRYGHIAKYVQDQCDHLRALNGNNCVKHMQVRITVEAPMHFKGHRHANKSCDVVANLTYGPCTAVVRYEVYEDLVKGDMRDFFSAVMTTRSYSISNGRQTQPSNDGTMMHRTTLESCLCRVAENIMVCESKKMYMRIREYAYDQFHLVSVHLPAPLLIGFHERPLGGSAAPRLVLMAARRSGPAVAQAAAAPVAAAPAAAAPVAAAPAVAAPVAAPAAAHIDKRPRIKEDPDAAGAAAWGAAFAGAAAAGGSHARIFADMRRTLDGIAQRHPEEDHAVKRLRDNLDELERRVH
jgi:hypothetical protein